MGAGASKQRSGAVVATTLLGIPAEELETFLLWHLLVGFESVLLYFDCAADCVEEQETIAVCVHVFLLYQKKVQAIARHMSKTAKRREKAREMAGRAVLVTQFVNLATKTGGTAAKVGLSCHSDIQRRDPS